MVCWLQEDCWSPVWRGVLLKRDVRLRRQFWPVGPIATCSKVAAQLSAPPPFALMSVGRRRRVEELVWANCLWVSPDKHGKRQVGLGRHQCGTCVGISIATCSKWSKVFFVDMCKLLLCMRQRDVSWCVASQNQECGYSCGLYRYLVTKIHMYNRFKFLIYILSTVF